MVIGGLISSTVMTLIGLPTLYNLVEGAKERRRARKGGPDAAAADSADDDEPTPEAPAGQLTRRELREQQSV